MAALARSFSDRHFERGEGPGDEVGKSVRWLRDINLRTFSGWAGRRDLKNIFSVCFPRGNTVNERYIRYYGWIKFKVGHEISFSV